MHKTLKRLSTVLLLIVLSAPPILSATSAKEEANLILEYAFQSAREHAPPDQHATLMVGLARKCAEHGFRDHSARALAGAVASLEQVRGYVGVARQIVKAYARAGLYGEAVRIAREVPDDDNALYLLLDVADVQIAAGDQAGAAGTLDACVARLLQVSNPTIKANYLGKTAQRRAELGQMEAAEELLHETRQAMQAVEMAGLPDPVLAQAVLTRAAMNQPDKVRALARAMSEPVEGIAALFNAAGAFSAAGREAEASALIALAEELGEKAEPGELFGRTAHVISEHSRQGRGEFALKLLPIARNAAERIAATDDRMTVLKRLAMLYAEQEQWDAAARLAEEAGDSFGKCRYQIGAVLQLAEANRPHEASRLLDSLSEEHMKAAGLEKLKELAKFYLRVRPGVGLQEIRKLGSSEFRDKVLIALAQSKATVGDCDAVVDATKEISLTAMRYEALKDETTTCLDGVARENASSAMAAARRAMEILPVTGYQLDILFHVALRQHGMGQRRQLEGTLKEMGALLEQDMRSASMATNQARLGLLLAHLDRKGEALKRVEKAGDAVGKISCVSCIRPTAELITKELSDSGHFELVAAFLELLDRPRIQSENCIRAAEHQATVSAEEKAKLLQKALQAGSQVLVPIKRIEGLVDVAAAYRRLGLSPGQREAEILRIAPAPIALGAAEPGPAPERPPTEKAKVVKLVYFKQPRCAMCRSAEKALGAVMAKTPGVAIYVQGVQITANAASLAMNKALCNRLNIPKRNHGIVPAIFSAAGGLVGEQITEKNLLALLEKSYGLPDPGATYITERRRARGQIKEEFGSLTPLVVVGAGLADGVNPCAFTVIIFFLSYLAYLGKDKKQIAIAGLLFTAAVFVTYFAIGMGLDKLMSLGQKTTDAFMDILYAATAAMALVACLLSLRDGFRCLRGKTTGLTLSLPDSFKNKIRLRISKQARRGMTVGATAVLGVVVAFIEFPCTGQIYGPIVAFVHESGKAVGWLLLYNLCFIVPLVAVYIGVFFGLTSEKLTVVFRRHIAKTKFALAFIFAVLCAVMVYFLLGGPIAVG